MTARCSGPSGQNLARVSGAPSEPAELSEERLPSRDPGTGQYQSMAPRATSG
jgi:hypothetical protein